MPEVGLLHLIRAKADPGRSVVIHDDVAVPEQNLGHVALDFNEIELALVHLVRKKIHDVSVENVEVRGFGKIFVRELLSPCGENPYKRQILENELFGHVPLPGFAA